LTSFPPVEVVWRTAVGSITFESLREQVKERCGIVLTDRRHPRKTRRAAGGADPDTVSLTELQRDGLFPYPTNNKPGRYHRGAAALACYLIATLGRGYGQRDPRHTARGRPEYVALRDQLRAEWLGHRGRYCVLWVPGQGWRSYDDHVARLERVAAGAAHRDKQVYLNALARARERLRECEAAAEDQFYIDLGLRWPTAKFLTDARGRVLDEVIAERIVSHARFALVRAGVPVDELVADEDLIEVTYEIRRDAGGRLVPDLARPSARVRRNGLEID
jgi:hypothetical protein